jgi:regulator of sigma E protease
MSLLIQVGQFLLSLSLLIVLHEGGHYLAARMFKTRVEKFYLFFDFLFPFPNLANFSLFKFKKGDTVYGLGWFPLGGYVKIAGMADESDDKEALKAPPKPDEYRSKKSWQRLIIIMGGIIVNLLLGFVLFIFLLWNYGETIVPPQNLSNGLHFSMEEARQLGLEDGDIITHVDGESVRHYESVTGLIILKEAEELTVIRNRAEMKVSVTEGFRRSLIEKADVEPMFIARLPMIIHRPLKNSPAEGAGLQAGDKVIGINDVEIAFIHEFLEKVKQLAGQEIVLHYERGGSAMQTNLQISTEGTIGVELENNPELLGVTPEIITYTFFAAIPAGIKKSVKTIDNYAQQFKLIFNPSTGAYKKVRGFAGIASMFPKRWSWQQFWSTTALLSLILAFMNFLPIPGLDGGYMLFILFEMVRGKPPGDKFLERANTVGFLIIIALLLYANLNDVFHIFK